MKRRSHLINELASVSGGFSPAPAEVPPFGDHEARNSAGPHPRVWGPGPKRYSCESSRTRRVPC
jgi:hypothetical protein